MGGALESLAIRLADYVIPFLTKLVEGVTSAIDAFANMNPVAQKVVLVIGGIVAAASPLLIIVGKIITAVGMIMRLIPKVSAAIKVVKTAVLGLNTTMLANPIFLIIAAIAALVAAFIYLRNNCEDFRQFWFKLWENIKQITIMVWNTIKAVFETALNVIKTAVGGWLGYFLGACDSLLIALLVFVVIDYVTGVMCAIVDKTLSSAVGFKGIFRKVLIFTLIGIGHILDINVLGDGSVLRTAIIFFYLSNEGVSLLENAGHLGLPIPDKMKKILAQLHNRKTDDENGGV